MGYELLTAHVYGTLSRHNSERDKEHDALWDDFVDRLRALVNDEKYKDIGLDCDAYKMYEE